MLFSEAPPYCFPQSTSFYFNRLFKGPLSRSSHLLRLWGLGLHYMNSGGWGHKSVHNRIQSLMGRGRGQNFVPNFSPKRSQEKSWSQRAHEVHFMKFNCVMLRINIAERIQVIVKKTTTTTTTTSPFWGSHSSPEGCGLGSVTDDLTRMSATVYSL